MKKILGFLGFLMITMGLYAQAVSLTNVFTFPNNITVVTTVGNNLTPVVSSLGAPLTNVPSWLPIYVNSQIYTNGVTTNNLKTALVLWGENPVHPKGIFQGRAPIWNGKYVCSLSNALQRVQPGDRLHLLLFGSDTNVPPVPPNTISIAQWLSYVVVDIPTTKPSDIP